MLIVNPNHRLRTDLAAIEPPLWAGLCASYMDADILDAEALDLTLDETEVKIRESGHKEVLIVVMGNNPSVSSTPKMPVSEALAERLTGIKVSLTGIHPIAVGSKFLVIEKPFVGFPMMPWDKLPMDKYRAHNWHCLDGSPRAPYASIYTSMGCPYNCYYCSIHTLYTKRQVWFRPISHIKKEVELLVKKYNIRNIKIWDELFTLKEDRVSAICSIFREYDGANAGANALNIWAYARSDTVTEKMLKEMKRSGINWLAYGFESADIITRKLSNKFFSNEQMLQAIKMTKDAGINIIGNFMFGLPGETEETRKETLSFSKEQLFEFVNFYEALPYPGSQWYNDTKPSLAWNEYDQYKKERMPFRDMAFREYFTNPDYLSMIGKRFGNQAVKQIKNMLKEEVKRA